MCKNISIPIGFNYSNNITTYTWEFRNSNEGKCSNHETPIIIYIVVFIFGFFIFCFCLTQIEKANKKLEAERVERQMNPEMRFENKDEPIAINV
tara:strand:- start:52 stop:333 length:282 start_codon:yes stop_codon:yes gene_type:complete